MRRRRARYARSRASVCRSTPAAMASRAMVDDDAGEALQRVACAATGATRERMTDGCVVLCFTPRRSFPKEGFYLCHRLRQAGT